MFFERRSRSFPIIYQCRRVVIKLIIIVRHIVVINEKRKKEKKKVKKKELSSELKQEIDSEEFSSHEMVNFVWKMMHQNRRYNKKDVKKIFDDNKKND